jgi:hypothetical protein
MKGILKPGDVIYIPNNPLHNDHQILVEDWTPKKILGIKFERRKPELRVLNFSRLHPSKELSTISDMNDRLDYIVKAGVIKSETRTYIKFEKK